MAFSGVILVRIAFIKLIGEDDAFYPKLIQINLCGIVLLICITAGERCKHNFLIFTGTQIQPNLKIRATKLICRLSFYLCIGVLPLSLTLVSAIDPCLPFNPVWFLSDNCSFIYHRLTALGLMKVALKMFVNFITWEKLSMGGFCIVSDILLGTTALVLYQHVMLNKLRAAVKMYLNILHPNLLSKMFQT